MDESNSEVAIRVSGNLAAIAGDPDLIGAIFNLLDVGDGQAQRLGRGTADLLAGVTGLGALTASLDGSWVQLTAESHRRLVDLAKFNLPKDGVFSAVIRGNKGRIDSFAQFTTGGLNPLVMSNLATLTATMAVRSAVAHLEDLVESMDVKLDQLLEDNRAKAASDILGLTQVLSRAFVLFEGTGHVSETTWSQIAGHATALSQASSQAMTHIDSLTRSIGDRSFTETVAAAKTIADHELRSWLVILAASEANQQRLETLELAHLGQSDQEAVPSHAASIDAAAQERRESATQGLQSLLDAMASAADVSDFNRIRSPQKSRQMLDSAERSSALIGNFAEIYGIDSLLQSSVDRESWRKSLSDLARTTTAAVTSVAKIVPTGIARAGGDVVVRAARQIEAKRASGEGAMEKDQARAEQGQE